MPLKTIMTTKWYYFMGMIGAYLSPLTSTIIAVGVLIVIDMVFGLIGAYKQKIKISSRRLSDTLIKMLVYQLLIISGFIIETTLVDWIPFTKIVVTFISITEIISIDENFTNISGLPFINYLKNIIRNLFKNDDLRDLTKKKDSK